MTKMTYSDQLRHPMWQRKRLETLQRAEFRCERCSDAESTLHVHHKRYVKGRMAWEYEPRELIALCESCHAVVHDETDRLQALLTRFDADGGPFDRNRAAAILAGFAAGCVGYEDDEGFGASDQVGFCLGVLTARLQLADHWVSKHDDIAVLADCVLDDKFMSDLKGLVFATLKRLTSDAESNPS